MAGFVTQDPLEERLRGLEEGINRLRVEYDQYFLGSARREPQTLRSQVERLITELMNEPPKNAAQKFRLHSLTSRFHALRARWGQTLREIEAGTYRQHRFKANLRTQAPAPTTPPPARQAEAARPSASDRIYEAYCRARTKTGEGAAGGSRESLSELLRKQSDRLRDRHPEARIAFRVVIEDNRAKIKTSIGKK